jgi:hypothetical protein
MSTSIRSQILAAYLAALNAAGSPCTWFRSRMDEFQLSDLPAGNVFYDAETNQIDADESENVLTLQVAGVVAVAQDPVDVAIDALLVWAEQAIAGAGNLGGLIVWVEKKGTQWFMEQKGVEMCGAIIKFDVNYRTALTDSTTNDS